VSAYDFSAQTNVRNNNYWPGVADVDWIGIDQYNGGCSGRYMSFSDMLASSVAWTQAKAPGVPVMLAEWGAPEGSTPDAKANFFAGVPSALVQPGYDQIQALVYWNEASSSTCNFRIDTSPQSFSAFAALGLSPSFTQLPLLPPASPPPAPTPPESG
jgi:beta-mannanase